ncbi:MAG: hypothetical protein ABR529_05905 [Actinomycetota bacterium]
MAMKASQPGGTDPLDGADQRFLGHLFNGVYESLLPSVLRSFGFEVLAGDYDESGRANRPVVREKTLFGHVEARRITTFDYLLARGEDVFIVEATGWRAAGGIAPSWRADTPRRIEGRAGADVVRRLVHLDLRRHECLINRTVSPQQPTRRMLLWWDVDDSQMERMRDGEPFYVSRRKTNDALIVGSLKELLESFFQGVVEHDPARRLVSRYDELSGSLWQALQRGDLSLLDQ